MERKLTDEQQTMVVRAIPMAKHFAGKFYNKEDDEILCGYSYEDLYSECCIKAIECAALYDAEREAEFTTFAYIAMYNKMIDLMRRKKYLYEEAQNGMELSSIDYTPITLKELHTGPRKRGPLGKNTFPAHTDNYFSEVNVNVLMDYCDEMDKHLPNLPAKAFLMIYPKIVDKNIRPREVARLLKINEASYNNAMNRIRQWLRRTHKDLSIIEDCCDSI